MTISEAHCALTHQRCDVHVSLRGLAQRSCLCRGGRRHAATGSPSQGCGQMTISEAHGAFTHPRGDVHVSLRGLYRDTSNLCRGGRRHAGGMTYWIPLAGLRPDDDLRGTRRPHTSTLRCPRFPARVVPRHEQPLPRRASSCRRHDLRLEQTAVGDARGEHRNGPIEAAGTGFQPNCAAAIHDAVI